jgi:methionine-rich copper-binding protein CopC
MKTTSVGKKTILNVWRLTLGLAVAVMLSPHDAVAANQDPTSIMSIVSVTDLMHPGVVSKAQGKVGVTITRQKNAINQGMVIAVGNLAPSTPYGLIAFIGDDTNATGIADFTTDRKGSFSVTYEKKGNGKLGPHILPLPEALDPLCNVREVDVINRNQATVLQGYLNNPNDGQYVAIYTMNNTGFHPTAKGGLTIQADPDSMLFWLVASGLTPNTKYGIMINGHYFVQPFISDKTGRLNVKGMPPWSPDVLDIHMVALTDKSGTNILLTTAGLGVPCDTFPPTVTSISPTNTATGVPINSQLTATFTESMIPATITTNTFSLQQDGTPVAGTVTYEGGTATFAPATNLLGNTLYTATITTGVMDLSGFAMAANFVWTFTTGAVLDTTPPTVSSTTPADTATNVPVSSQVTATFSEAMNPATITTNTFTLQQGGISVTGLISYASGTATFAPATNLLGNTLYTATITTGVTDLAGNALAANFVWTFTTGAAPDITPPTVTSTTPTNTASGVPVSSQVTATFSEAMNPATITANTFTLQQGGISVTGLVSYASGTATFVPATNLLGNTLYTATITTGVTDMAGNALAANFVWTFTTGAAPDITPPTVTSTTPADTATGVPINDQITATFSEAMNPATITTNTFTLQQGGISVTGLVSYVGGTATFAPAVALITNTLYTATVTTGVTDLASNALAANFVWSFTTGATPDTTAPTVISTTPVDTSTNVPINSQVTATFSEALNPATITNTTFTLQRGGISVTGLVSYVGGTATFAPAAALITNTLYTAIVTTGVTDLASNALAANFVWSFTTSSSTDTNPPIVISTYPTNTSAAVAINQSVNATFNKAMDAFTVSTANFTVTGPDGSNIVGTVAYLAGSDIATFTPTANLMTNTTYTNTIVTGVKDQAGNALATNYVWTFTTGSQVDSNKMSIPLGAASTFAIMATAATSGGADVINGDVGLSPGSSQGIPPVEINGTVHVNDQAVTDAQASLLAAYNEAVNRSVNAQSLPGDLGGLTLTPGLYVNGSSSGISGAGANAILTLDAQGDANAVFVFQMASTLTTDSGTSIVLANGAQAKNIYWQVGSSATLGTTSIFKGNILAFVTITVNNGTIVDGRLFAGSGGNASGAVTVQSSTVTVPAP